MNLKCVSILILVDIHGGDGSKPGLYNSLVPKIDAEVRTDYILKVTALKFKSYVSFGVGSNSRLSGRGSIFFKKVPLMERLLL